MAGIDMEPLRALNEDFMVDTCIIRRDAELTGDDTWDPDTGTYTRPAGDRTTIYSGKCMLYVDRNSPSAGPNGGQEVFRGYYFLEIPYGSVMDVNPEDDVEITSAANFPKLLGATFLIDNELLDSFNAARRFRLHDIQVAP